MHTFQERGSQIRAEISDCRMYYSQSIIIICVIRLVLHLHANLIVHLETDEDTRQNEKESPLSKSQCEVTASGCVRTKENLLKK